MNEATKPQLVDAPRAAYHFNTAATSGRELEIYCGEVGGEKLQSDLSDALDATVNQIVHDFGLKLQ